MTPSSAGARFRAAMNAEDPLQIIGAINAYTALMAEKVGYRAIYLSGGGVAAGSLGVPDLGITTLHDVLEDARRITSRTAVPLLVDVDTGWGGAFNIARMIKEMTNAGVAAVQIEDQVQAKRCGHRPGKTLVPIGEMCDRLKTAVDARTDEAFVIVARTDALANEGVPATLERAQAYVQAGADIIFLEAATELGEYHAISEAISVPILANITEFGKTPLFTVTQLHKAGVKLVLYPLSAFRAMNAAALKVYQTIREHGTQQPVLDLMQTREALYQFLDYYSYEKKLDQLFANEEKAQ